MPRWVQYGALKLCMAAVLHTLLFTPGLLAFHGKQSLPPFDRRLVQHAGAKEMPAPDIQQAEANLRHALPSVRVDYHPQLRTPVHVRCLDGCLTGPGGVGKGVQEKTLALIPRSQSHRPIRAFLLEHSSLFHVGAAELDQAILKRDQRSRSEVVRTTVWQQQCEGIPVFESVLSAHMTRADELLAISSTFVPDVGTLSRAWDDNTTELLKNPPVSAESAIGMAATSIGEDSSGLSSVGAVEQGSALLRQYQAPAVPGVITASLVWLPLARNAITLCWKVELTRRQAGERYQVLIDARSGLLMLRRCLTVYLQPATYEVFTSDSPTPLSPAYCEPTSRQPAAVRREVVTLSALSTNASPLGWIANNLNETRGNNVEAHLDHNADDYPDLPRPRGSPARVFRPPLDFRKIPEHNADAAVVQLFYWCNWMHDQLYDLGFTESAGNYQKDNFGRGGLGGDPIMADAQDGSGLNNANFTPTPDGEPGRIQMFIFDGPEPDRDGDFDAEIVIHEYVHGLSTRLVGGGVGISTLQAGGMGEGWSDFYALAMLSEASDDPDGCYAMGGYVTRQFFGLEENYYFGIRRYPYSTDLKKNPLTFKDLDPAQISRHDTVPRNPIFPFSPGLASEVHNQGELWCATLWDARARLIRKLGFEQGNREILQLVTLGMKLSPSNPNFLQARDAVLQADLAMNAGRHHEDLWNAFARRGMGFSAWSPVSSTTAGIREAFDLPDGLGVGSPDGLVFSGAVGGPFFGGMRSLSLTNHTRAAIDWTAGHDASWLLLDPGQGRLEPGEAVRISLNTSEEALGMPKGRYLSRLVLTNLTSGVTQERQLDLRLMAFGSIPFEDGFEDQDLRPEWLPASPAFGRILLTALGGPQAGGQHALMDSDSDGLPARNELTLGLDMRGWTNVVLRFFAREYSDEPNLPPPSPYEFGANTDNVAISVDGRLWHEVKSLRSLTDSYKEVLVPLNETLAAAGLEYGPHMQIRFTQFDNYPIPLDGIAIDSVQVSGLPTGRYQIKLPPQLFEGSVTNEAGLVILGTPAARPVEFKLMADPPGLIVLPSILRFEVGQTQASFEMQPLDNLLLEGPRRLHIQAQAPGYFGSSALTMVQDDEPALLTITAPGRVVESTNPMPTRVTLQLDRSPESALEIAIRTLPSGKLSHPPSVIIPAGLRETSFDVAAGDNPDLEGDVDVRLMADQPGGGVVEALITIADNDSPTLSLELPAAISESNPAQTGWVRLGGLVRTNVVVALQSLTPGQARVADSVTVPSGEISASFQLTPLDDAIVDGHALVKVTGTAEGFLEGASETRILDNETPSEIYAPDPAHMAQNIPSRTFLRWRPGFGELLTNGDFESGDLRGWKTSQDSGSGFVINDGNVNPDGPESPSPPLEGGFSALLAQSTPGKHSIWQDVFIPADAESASLSWAHFIHNHGPEYFNPSQRFAVEIRSPQGDLLATAFSTRPGDNLAIEWTTNRFDLTSMRGRTVRVLFAEEDVLGFINVGIDLVSLDVHSSGRTLFDVYLGKSSDLGPSDLIATTESAEALVSGLSPESDYYWKVASRKGTAVLQGPLWKFRTRPVGILDHFEWGQVPTPLQSGVPFVASLSARDEYGLVATNFHGYVRLTGHGGWENSDTILITEIDAGRDDQVEFTNVGVSPVELGGWTFAFYDLSRWPDPRVSFTLPAGAVALPGDTFVIRELGRSPGTFPEYRLGVTLGWGFLLFNQPIAIMVLDPQGNVVDFACAVDASPFRIQKPKALPLVEWNGAPLAALTAEATTWQRVGSRDTDSPDDWRLAPRTIKQRNLQLDLPFAAKSPLITEPSLAGPFSNGLWTGSMRVSGSATEASLRAIGPSNNAAGDLGSITVEATKDLAALLLHRPSSTLVDEPLSLGFALTNTGPVEARAITWNVRFPPELRLQSATGEGAKGSAAPDGWRFQWDLIPPRSAREILLTFQPAEPGSYKLLNEIPQTPGDSAPDNNFLQLRLDVGFPLVVVQNTTVLEGNNGTSQARFRVRLSGPIQRVVEVDYTTVDGAAVAGFDYQSTQGTLVFPPGVTQQFIEVPVIGDRIFELFESFDVTLSRARNATIADGTASASIIEDEVEPTLHVGSVTFVEGQPEDAPVATVPIFLTGALGRIAAANWFTADATALAGGDYVTQRGQVIFLEGQTQHVARIPLIGDRRHEGAEFFSVVLTNLFAVRAGVDRAQVQILDDDAGELHSLGLIVPSEPQTAGRPFTVSVHAVDASGARRHDFEGRVQIRAFRSVRTNAVARATNEWGFPLRSYFEDARGQYLYSTNELGPAGLLSSIEINLKSIPGQVLENFRLRCKPHASSSLEGAEWDNSGWTTLFEGDWQPPHAGWVNLPLSTPFPYDGIRPLLLDILFDNGIYSFDGMAFATDTGVLRSRVFATDSAFGPPTAWDGIYPRPELSTLLPAMRFSLEETVPISQPGEIILRGGQWTGELTIAEAGESVRLAALTAGGLMGSSAAIRVMPGLSQIQPTITAIRLDGSHVEIRFQGQPGITYQVDGTDTLSSSRWVPLGQPVVAGTSELTHREILPGEGNSRFYRVRVATDP